MYKHTQYSEFEPQNDPQEPEFGMDATGFGLDIRKAYNIIGISGKTIYVQPILDNGTPDHKGTILKLEKNGDYWYDKDSKKPDIKYFRIGFKSMMMEDLPM